MNDISAYMAEQLAVQLAKEKDNIIHACVRNRVGPSVRIKEVLGANRVRCLIVSPRMEMWQLDNQDLVEIWAPEVKSEPTEDGRGSRMVASIAYRVHGVTPAEEKAIEQLKNEGFKNE